MTNTELLREKMEQSGYKLRFTLRNQTPCQAEEKALNCKS